VNVLDVVRKKMDTSNVDSDDNLDFTSLQFVVCFNQHSRKWTAFETTQVKLRHLICEDDDPSDAIRNLMDCIEERF
jgi:hypothetical protein